SANVRDPFIYRAPNATSTWEFYDYHGRLDVQAALGAWTAAYWDAERRVDAGHGDQRLGTQTRKWSAGTTTAGDEDGEDVILVLVPREEMTWRMLAEAYKGARLLICNDGRNFGFRASVPGTNENVGFGDTTTRKRKSSAAADWADRGLTVRRRSTESDGSMWMPRVQRQPNGKTAVGFPLPFYWHHTGMVSTWVFYGYRGQLDHNSAAMAALAAFSAAMHGHEPDGLIGEGTRVWSGTYHDADTVDLLLNARPNMTWRMLMEGITGAQMVAYEGKEFQFRILAEGFDEHVGTGHFTRRVSGSLRRLDVRDARRFGPPWRLIPAERVPAALSHNRMCVHRACHSVSGKLNDYSMSFPSPYIRHDPDMISTWEYFGYHGTINVRACLSAWKAMFVEARQQVVSGRGDEEIGIATRHWPIRSGDDWVDLVVIPRETMTWRMLQEGMVGGLTVCADLESNFSFGVIADGIEGEVGYGEITARPKPSDNGVM
ncbi:MAG: hypothetical protein LQ341_001808, partial [Variospora aurantia]